MATQDLTDKKLFDLIAKQENSLVLDHFDEEVAHEIGERIRKKALGFGAPIAIDIRSSSRRYYYSALPGSSPENEDWAIRKGNTVLRCFMSSMRVGLLHKLEGREQWPDGGLHHSQFVTHGGAFPINVAGMGVVATIGISGLPSIEDHQLSVDVLSEYLNVETISL